MMHMHTIIKVRGYMVLGLALLSGCSENVSEQGGIDNQLSMILNSAAVTKSIPLQKPGPAKTKLGQMLFFEKLISGNQDTACATCHHPLLQTGDGLALSIGTKGAGIGPLREKAFDQGFIPRNSPDLFNRGLPEWQFLFWDGRVSGDPRNGFISPAGAQLPAGLESVLAVQALFPPTSRDEMRGNVGDLSTTGMANELALYGDDDFQGIWNGIVQRLLAIPEYQVLFTEAYPGVPLNQITIVHVANAIAAFEAQQWTFLNSPFDQYLAGDLDALSMNAKKGALLFYGKAGCSECHAGVLLTDQQFHNVAVPQLGPGKDSTTLDQGRILETNNPTDKFCFRTPSLRNVSLTGPWMHNGAYSSLEGAVKHMLNPVTALQSYDVSQLEVELQSSVKNDIVTQNEILTTIDPKIRPRLLDATEFQDLMAFLESLTDPAAINLVADIPERLPSGLSLN